MNNTRDAGRVLHVLLVEDNAGDVRLTREAFKESGRLIELHVVTDGAAAIDFLRRAPPFAAAPRPDIILLDLNLPVMDGREVLAIIKQDSSMKTIPTIVLTTSDAEADILRSYQLNANCYLTKPIELEAFETLVKSITNFWITMIRLPSGAP